METRNLTCIGCPLGCAITVTMDGGNVRFLVSMCYASSSILMVM